MKVIKLFRNPNKPEFYKLVRGDSHAILVNYPIDKPNRKREARWFYADEVYVDWIRTFKGEEHGDN
jgi:hypothetical protein